MISPCNAWTLARLLGDLPVNGELEAVSKNFQPIARRLGDLPMESRQAAWDAFLDGQPDRDDINRAVAAADPEGPPPDSHEDGEGQGDWPPIRLGGLPPAEPFPLDVLPEAMARLVSEGAEAIGCPTDLIALPTLIVAGGVIGRSVSLLLKGNYFASACLWGATVAPPGDAKSPGWRLASDAVARIDETLADDHRREMDRWQEESVNPPEGKKRPIKTQPPKPRRIDVDDITMENVPLILADNPRGVIRLVDELASIMLGMNQFKGGKGNDKQILLKMWSGMTIKKDRVGHESNIPIRCNYPFLAIGGGIQPDMLGSMVDPSGRADGFLDRWLFAYPDSLPVPGWSEAGVSEGVIAEWCDLVGRLWSRPLEVKEGRSVPHVAFLTPDGKAAWEAIYNAHAAEMNDPNFPPSLRGPWAKLREYAGRLALVLACVHHAADPTLGPLAVPRVDRRVVEGAWRLVDYFKAHARRVHHVIALGPGSGGSAYKAIVEWIRKGGRESLSESEIKQARRWITEADLSDALKALVRRNAIREAPAEPTGGRPRSPTYLVNPALFATENS